MEPLDGKNRLDLNVDGAVTATSRSDQDFITEQTPGRNIEVTSEVLSC